MTIVVTAVYQSGIVMGADSEELTRNGFVENGEQNYSSEKVNKIIEMPTQCILLGMAGDADIYINGQREGLRDWLLSNFFQDEDALGRTTLRELAASIWTRIDDMPVVEYGQNGPSTILLFRCLSESEGYEISNAREFKQGKMNNHFSCRKLRLAESSAEEPCLFTAGFPEAGILFQELFTSEGNIESTLKSFLKTDGDSLLRSSIENIKRLRSIDRRNFAKSEAWLKDCVVQICSLWKMAGHKGISEPVNVCVTPQGTF